MLQSHDDETAAHPLAMPPSLPPPVAAASHDVEPVAPVAPADVPPATFAPPPAAPPAPTGAQEGRVGVKVGGAVMGKGYVRPYTYFPLSLESTLPAGGSTSVVWETGSRVYRRYSEIVLLRRYLVLQHPGVIVPPLPPKTTGESMKTTLAMDNALKRQKTYLAHFFALLGRRQELFVHDFLVQQFLQLLRDDNDLEPESRENTGTAPQGTGRPPRTGSFTATLQALAAKVHDKESVLGLNTAQAASTAPGSGALGSMVRSAASWWSGGSASTAPTEQQLRSYLEAQGTAFPELVLRRAAWEEHRHKVEAASREAELCRDHLALLVDAEQAEAEGFGGLAAALSADSERELAQEMQQLQRSTAQERAVSQALAQSLDQLHDNLFVTAAYDGAVIEALDLALDQWRAWAARHVNPLDCPKTKDCEPLRRRRQELDDLSRQLFLAIASFQRDVARRMAAASLSPTARNMQPQQPEVLVACQRALSELRSMTLAQ